MGAQEFVLTTAPLKKGGGGTWRHMDSLNRLPVYDMVLVDFHAARQYETLSKHTYLWYNALAGS